MFQKVVSSVIALAVLASSPVVAAPQCADVFLNESQIDYIRRVHKTPRVNYKVKTLNGTVGGKKKTVVFLGEAHRKSKREAEIGNEAVRLFRNRGHEGVEVSRYVGGPLMKGMMIGVGYVLKLVSFGRMSEGSTIHESIRPSMSETEWAEKQKVKFSWKKDKCLEYNNPDNDKLLKGVTNDGQDKLFWLEAGHKPNFVEQFGSVAVPALFAWGIYDISRSVYYTFKSAPTTEEKSSDEETQKSFRTNVLNLALGAGSWMLLPLFFRFQIVETAMTLPLRPFLITPRDRTMSKNVVRIFQEHPEVDNLLVLVGGAHVNGIAKNLAKEHEFEEVAIEDLEVGPCSDEAPPLH